ncbi:hypothetical protein [Tsukamurella tyrosinosolvens]|uniref:hypothetical protein n=1 Tax=Tsukamurella tyrosinosolvens TaxID=57704 RepID=UPI00114669C5|nr:hypothetical protein [Tsukamurella tyrosinosolvens]
MSAEIASATAAIATKPITEPASRSLPVGANQTTPRNIDVKICMGHERELPIHLYVPDRRICGIANPAKAVSATATTSVVNHEFPLYEHEAAAALTPVITNNAIEIGSCILFFFNAS